MFRSKLLIDLATLELRLPPEEWSFEKHPATTAMGINVPRDHDQLKYEYTTR